MAYGLIAKCARKIDRFCCSYSHLLWQRFRAHWISAACEKNNNNNNNIPIITDLDVVYVYFELKHPLWPLFSIWFASFFFFALVLAFRSFRFSDVHFMNLTHLLTVSHDRFSFYALKLFNAQTAKVVFATRFASFLANYANWSIVCLEVADTHKKTTTWLEQMSCHLK